MTDTKALQAKYNTDLLPRVEAICKLGATEAELGAALGVHRRTIIEWAQKYPEFEKAMRAGKDSADNRVERSLYNRAVGYTFESEKIFCTKEGDVVRAPIMEHVPPDVTAQCFWLKNRKPRDWAGLDPTLQQGIIVQFNLTYKVP